MVYTNHHRRRRPCQLVTPISSWTAIVACFLLSSVIASPGFLGDGPGAIDHGGSGRNTPFARTYADTVCRPPKAHPGDPLPPCVDIENIETLCWPNGTAPLYLAAHAQCMCGGSYFAEWNACRRCLVVHGQLSEPDWTFYQGVATAASAQLCDFISETAAPAPTAIFRDLFTSVLSVQQASATTTTPSAVATDLVPGPDQAPSDTNVGLYFTATGPLGPGPITGSETLATATNIEIATEEPPSPGVPTPTKSGSGTGNSTDSGEPAMTAPPSWSPSTSTNSNSSSATSRRNATLQTSGGQVLAEARQARGLFVVVLGAVFMILVSSYM